MKFSPSEMGQYMGSGQETLSCEPVPVGERGTVATGKWMPLVGYLLVGIMAEARFRFADVI